MVLDLAWVTVVAYGVDHGVDRPLTNFSWSPQCRKQLDRQPIGYLIPTLGISHGLLFVKKNKFDHSQIGHIL